MAAQTAVLMFKFSKAASFAAVLVTLGSTAILAGPGFASGEGEAETVLTADMIQVDEQVLSADAEALKLAKREDMTPSVGKTGEVVFTPGTGDFVQTYPEPDPVPEALPEIPTNATSLRALVRATDTSVKLDKQANCLAGAIYFESKSESLAGQLAVARVVMARAKSKRFPNSLCGVVFQKRSDAANQ